MQFLAKRNGLLKLGPPAAVVLLLTLALGLPALGAASRSASPHGEGKSRVLHARLTPGGGAEVLSNDVRAGEPVRHRSSLAGDDQLTILGRDAAGHIIWQSFVTDPAVARAESAGPDGRLTGTELRTADAALTLEIPDDPLIRTVEILSWSQTGSARSLKVRGVIRLG